MMREGLLKENIDGEALDWAHKRLLGRPEQRRILMVISDGAPVDDSTLSVNPGNYLERHLRYVIEDIETRSPVELIAIGIGHDVTRYYRRAVTIVDAEELGGAMTEKLAELFEENGPEPAPRRRAAGRSLETHPPVASRSAHGSALAGGAVGGTPWRSGRLASGADPDRGRVRRRSAPFRSRDPERRRFGALDFPLRARPRIPHKRVRRLFGAVALARRAQTSSRSPTMRNGSRRASSSPTTGASRGCPTPSWRRSSARTAGRCAARRYYDTEGLTLSGGDRLRRRPSAATALLRFDWARDGVSARAQPRPAAGRRLRSLPSNGGLEALGVAPPRSPLAGALVAIAERSHQGPDAPTTGLHPDGRAARTPSGSRAPRISTSPISFSCPPANAPPRAALLAHARARAPPAPHPGWCAPAGRPSSTGR